MVTYTVVNIMTISVLQAVEDLQSVEMAFSDLHRRYEKMKGVVEGFKKVSL